MAVRNATRFGLVSETSTSMYGEKLVANDGNGDMYGEMTVEVDNDPVSLQLADISAMRSEIARSPLPGDAKVLEYLAFDEAILRSDMGNDYVSPILQTYPDMPDILRESVEQNPDIIRAFDQEQPELALAAFKEAPIEFLQALETEEAHQILLNLASDALDAPAPSEHGEYALSA